jgi:hypothetical protein
LAWSHTVGQSYPIPKQELGVTSSRDKDISVLDLWIKEKSDKEKQKVIKRSKKVTKRSKEGKRSKQEE